MRRNITYQSFHNGLDLRRSVSMSDASTQRVLRNAHVTAGKTLRKRPGLTLVAALEPGTVGLSAGGGKLNTYYGGTGTITHANSLFRANNLRDPVTAALAITAVHYSDMFNGFSYVSVEYTGGGTRHHYLDGAAPGATHIVDVNCPNTRQVIKIASKIWAVGTTGDTVRYCATNLPRDWTAANNAGFLPVGLQHSGASSVTALGFYLNRLVVFFMDSAQVWAVDPDPAKNALLFGNSIDIGTAHRAAHANMAGDVFFLSPAGVKTITRQDVTMNLVDTDIGASIDDELLKGTLISLVNPRAQYYLGGGQYWLYSGSKALVFTFSRTTGIAAWSLYEYPFAIDYMDELNADLYLRSGNNVYRVDRAARTDAGALYSVDIELPYVDFKAPGVLKKIHAMDAVVTGTCQISHRYDARSPALVTDPPVTISGDSRPGNMFPVELLAVNIAPVLRNFDDQDFELHGLSYTFSGLGMM